MKKKKYRRYRRVSSVVAVAVAVAVLSLSAVLIYQHPLPGMEGWFPEQKEEPVVASQPTNEQPAVGSQVDSNTQESKESSKVESSAAPTSSLTDEDTFRIDPAKTYQLGETFQAWTFECPVEFTVHSATLSKDLQGNDKSIFLYPPTDDLFPEYTVITDEKGNLLSPHFYLFVKMTVKNTKEVFTDVSMGNIRAIPIEKESRRYDDDVIFISQIGYIDANREKFGSDDYGYLDLEAYEEKEVVVGYVIYEPGLLEENDLFLQFNIRGEGVAENQGSIYFHPVVDLKLP